MTLPSEHGRPEDGSRRRRVQTLHHEPEAVTWARTKAGLTKRALAQQIGISEALMGEIESGWRNATPANLLKIATALNCPVVFLERKRPPEPPTRQQPEAPVESQQHSQGEDITAKRHRG